MRKTWNVRDQTTINLNDEVEKLYKDIDKEYKLLKKVSNIEDAERLLKGIWFKKSWANQIQLELIRRGYADET